MQKKSIPNSISVFQKPNKIVGWSLVVLLSVVPILIWIFTPKAQPVFKNFSTMVASMGEIFGLVGMVMFSLNLILSARLHFIEKLFNGLNDVYQKHNLLGQMAFILLLFHPLFLLPRYSATLKEAASFLWISDSLARNLGIFALMTMLVLITLTLYLRPKYNIWKITHKFFGFALFLGSLHAYFIPSYIMKNSILKMYVLGFAILGILAFIYRTILGKFIIKKYEYSVQNVEKMNNKTIEITLKPKNEKLNFVPGQFIFISFLQKGLSKEEHPFSILSSPEKNLLKIAVKASGDYTQQLWNNLQVGTTAMIEGPFGAFSYQNYNNKNQIWIAGGIGITPFISFIESIKPNSGYNIKLFYCVKKPEEAVYLNLCKQSEQFLTGTLQVIPFYSEEKGHINAEHIFRQVANFKKYDYYVCAPPKMIIKLKQELVSAGITNEHIHSEEFDF